MFRPFNLMMPSSGHHQAAKIIMYSHIICKKERDLDSTFASAYNKCTL